MNYENWKQLWRIGRGAERLGQAFINEFFKEAIWPELFYQENYFKADDLITEFLVLHCYYPNLPTEQTK